VLWKEGAVSAYFVLVPSLALTRVISRLASPQLILRPRSRRREQQEQVSAAKAGRAVDLSRALPRSLHRELASWLRCVADDERRRLAKELATFTTPGPARVRAVAVVPGKEQCLRLEFGDGWELIVSGMAASSARRLLQAARTGMQVTGVDVVDGLAFRLRLRWSVPGQPGQGHTVVQLAALRGP
jgi:hypothetical protein